tara:strand:+ start:2601 stop:2894 length:294 start_codon:yes stop_codon:yes gene_type:complete
MADFGLLEEYPLNIVFTRGSEAIIFESITPKMITFCKGYCNNQYKTITIYEDQHYTKKVFSYRGGDDNIILYVKMGGDVGAMSLNNFFIVDDDYVIN